MSDTNLNDANFTPTIPDSEENTNQQTYSATGSFRFWCQKVLPLVYDDSLSYYELLCKVVNYLNNVIQNVDNLNTSVTNTNTAFNNLQDYVNDTKDALILVYSELEQYVNDYFNNLDVQEEINTKLDSMASDGSLSTLLSPFIPSLVSDWLSENITPTSPAIDASLTVSGAGADAEVTGELIRANTTELADIRVDMRDAIDEINAHLEQLVRSSANLLNPDNILQGHFYAITTVEGRAHIETRENSAFSCAYVDITPGTDYIATGISYNAYTASADGYAVGIAYNASSSVSAPVFDSDARNSNYANDDKTISRIYFSWRTATYPTDTMMVVEGTTLPESYIPYSIDLNNDIGVHWSQIKDAPEINASYTVDVNGTGDYTSFTSCLKALENDTSPKTIYVKAGTYDIFTELGGQTYAESISGQGYQWFDVSTVVPPNTRIIGIGEVVLKFKPTAAQIPSDVASLLSPVNVIYDVYMENITIDADNCRYCIHDETGHIDDVVETRHIYKNVKLIKKRTNVGMDAAFGCGMQRGQYMEFDGCIFSAPNRPFSFHNKGTDGYIDGTIIVIKDSVAVATNNGNALRFGNVNGKQVKIDVRVINCYLAGQIIVLNESSTERPNAYALTLVRCGSPTVTVENATNIYPPVVYA